ncbi:MAG: hypothetical protein K0S80_5234 [Neobacillus sp.]|nr:hypothetical protein [Neobacillus sp.]
MKNGKNPSKRHKQIIKSCNLNPENWLVYKVIDGRLHLVHRNTGTTIVVPN